MRIEADAWVTVRYRLFDSTGEELESAERELTYLHGGYGAVFERIEAALDGHETGFATSVYLQPEDTFGDYDSELIRLVERDRLPADLEEGMTFDAVPGEPPDGLLYTVTNVSDEAVVLDGNHPLAGMALRFDLRVTEVRQASADEVADERARAEAPGDPDAPTLH
jgi:FKBP-type peptidyl-prolyl cis-trans isomerase SlyD